MPLPNFHVCRIVSPGRFQEGSFRNITRGRGENRVQLVIARKKGQTTTSTQSVRYPIDVWSVDRAERHCKELEGTFERAS